MHILQMTSCVHKMCERTYGQTNMKRVITFAKINHPTQLVICFLSHFIHIWYLDWPWSEHAHIIPISRMVDFCESLLSQKSTIREIGIICACSDHGQSRYQIWIKCDKRQMTSCIHKMCERTYGQTNMKRAITLCESYSPLHVCLTIRPSAHLVYATSHLSFVAFYSYLVSWLAMIWACAYICACSDHGQPRYQIWIKCDKRQMTSCIHKMCGRTYGQTNMKRAITFAKINHPWNRYNMLVRPSLNLVYVTSHLSFVGFYSYLVSWLAMIWACAYYTDFTDGWSLKMKIWIYWSESNSWIYFYIVLNKNWKIYWSEQSLTDLW
jgi:hypothetical protein